MRNRRYLMLVFIVVLALPTSLLQAHHDQLCQNDFYQRTFDTLVQYAEIGKSAIGNGDAAGALNAVSSIRQITATVQALCTGLSFSSDTDGMTGTLGPVQIPLGIYQANLRTNGDITIQVTPVDGECSAAPLFDLSSGQAIAPVGANVIFQSAECIALVEVVNATDPWSLQFERLNIDENLLLEGN